MAIGIGPGRAVVAEVHRRFNPSFERSAGKRGERRFRRKGEEDGARFMRMPSCAPVPGGPDDFLEIGVARLPAEDRGGLGARAHEGGRVAGPAGLREHASLRTRDLLGGGDDLPDGEAVSISEIVVIRSPALDEAQEAEPVRLGEIVHVDIVAEAGSIGRGVVGPEYGYLRPPARQTLEHERYQVRLRIVALSYLTLGVAARRVEIAKHAGFEAEGPVVVFEDPLDHKLGSPVGIDRILRMRLVQGKAQSLSEGGAGGGEDEAPHAVGDHGVEERQRRGHVVAVYVKMR